MNLKRNYLALLKWLGTSTGIVGAVLVALHISQSGYGYVFFLLSSLSWFAAGWHMKESSILVLQGVFVAVNLLGIWRWLVVL
ncbi:MAG: hypothetical protein HQL68_04560 [Magnetococcales bacterium]|nr:hypothetical protein [Magnetococcales bacterium]